MTAKLTLISSPLPECDMCDTPTKRDVHKANRGLCTVCADAIADINHRLSQPAPSAALRPLYPADDQ